MVSELIIPIIIFIAALAVLIKSSDYFTEAAEKVGLHFGIPAFIVGVTIVAFGTSIPELVSSFIAIARDSSEIVTGNIVGSNIANLGFVLAIAAIVGKKLKVSWELIHVDLPLLMGSAILLTLTLIDGVLSFYEAILLLIGYVVYITYVIQSQKEHKSNMKLDPKIRKGAKKKKLGWKIPITLIVTSAFIFFSAKYLIDSVIDMSAILNIGKEVVAVSVVSIGTSLPEFAVSIIAVKRGQAELAIGNVLGSNIFNSFAIMGLVGLFSPLVVPSILITIAIPIMMALTLLYFFIAQDNEIMRPEGFILLLVFVFFLLKLFGLV